MEGTILPPQRCPGPDASMSATAWMDPAVPPPDNQLREFERFADIALRFDNPDAAGLANEVVRLRAEGWRFVRLVDCAAPAVQGSTEVLSAPEPGGVDWSGYRREPPSDTDAASLAGIAARLSVTSTGTSTRAVASWYGAAPENGPLVAAGASTGEPLRLDVELHAAPSGFAGTWRVMMSSEVPGTLATIRTEVTSGTVTSVDPGP